MIIDRIQRIFGGTRFNALLLEVFAIFLGISASFAVEEWREQRQDEENFERYLQAIYFDALREEAQARRFIVRGNQAVVATHILLNERIDGMQDNVLLTLVSRVFNIWSLPSGDSSYRALQAAGLSMPFDNLMQVLNASYELNSDARSQLMTQMTGHNEMVNEVRSQYGTVSNPTMAVRNEDRTTSAGSRFSQPSYRGIRSLFFRDRTFIPQMESVQHVRDALPRADVRRLLNEDLERTMQAMDLAIALTDTTYSIRQAIRKRLPNLRLAVQSLSVVGDATPTGWTESEGLPLQRERDGGDWWSAELELGDGSIKFVANGIWGTSWGAPIAWDPVDPLVDDRTFLGDPDAVFPGGVAEFDGLNIPVKAGRYSVRMNTHTFVYSFRPLD
jgi:hypothetical protein